eukprot:14925552-Ditylum_brightwellii.AAC.1
MGMHWYHSCQDSGTTQRETLLLDNFDINHTKLENLQHLISVLKEPNTITIYWTRKLFCGILLSWDYCNMMVDLPMPGYIPNIFHKFQHTPRQNPSMPHMWQWHRYINMGHS